LLTAGIVIGNTLQTRANAANAQLVAELRTRIEKSEAENARTQRVLADLSQTMARNRAEDQAALITVAQEAKATRRDLETVAVLTEAGMKKLASYTAP
jgi:microsomal dipeptidase-like Zn-dependent dipeptidase